MNYFMYSPNSHSVMRVIEVYEVVQSLKAYAISIYKGLWEEALDASFFHILNNFDEFSGNDLTHYATRVVGTILLNKYNKEYENDVALTTALDGQSVENLDSNPIEILISNEDEADKAKISSDVHDCIDYLLPMFIKDYKFFKTRKPGVRNLSYDGIFQKFSEGTVLKAMSFLCENYGSAMEELLELGKESNFRNFPENHYEKYLDKSVKIKSVLNGVLLYEKLTTRTSKKFYSVDIQGFLNGLFKVFYKSGLYSRSVGGCSAYCSLSGILLSSKEELYDCLEREVIGRILARSSVKVVKYAKGKVLILSSSKPIDSLSIYIKDIEVEVTVNQILAKCVNK